MRHIPYACGGCHLRNYVGDPKFPTILLPDVVRSHAVAMPGEAACLVRAVEHPALGLALAPMSTLRTRATRVVFLLHFDCHAKSLSFVGEQVADGAMRPLVNLLIVEGASIVVVPDIAHITNDHGLHTLLIQHGNEP